MNRNTAKHAAIVLLALGMAGCSGSNNTVILVTPNNDPAAKLMYDMLPPQARETLAKVQKQGTDRHLVLWKSGWGSPDVHQSGQVVCRDGAVLDPEPMVFQRANSKYVGRWFWVPPNQEPMTYRVGKNDYPLRWATDQETWSIAGFTEARKSRTP